ncbi:MAG: pitrilysin family protein, partial [Pseudomonadota bacterium]
KDEPQGQTGFAHLFEHLMFNGSENFDDDYFVALKDMGATQYNGTTSTDRTNYYQTVPTGALEQILFLESDRMGHLLGAVTQEKLDNQIGVVKNEKKVGDDRPFGRRIWYNIFENLYPVGHPYHHPTIGSMEDVGNATLEDVRDWFKKYYGAANAVLVLAGDIDTQTARPLLEKYFGHIPSGPPLVKASTNSVPLPTNKHGVFYDRVDQPRLYRAYIAPPTGSETSPLLDLMTRALASGKTSRLYKRLVDELELVNNINAGYSESMLSGQIYFITDVKRAQDIDRVNDIIDAEIAQFLKDGPTKDELQRAKTIYLSSEVRGPESVAGKAATLARGELFFGDPDFYVEENLNRMQAATRQQVREASAKYLQHGYYELQVLPFGQYQSSQAQYDRAQGLPDRGTPGELSFPETEEFTLSNGISVVVAPRPTIPVVELALQFDAGTATGNIAVGERSEALPYLAPMTTALMDEGTEKRSAQDIAELAEELGARIRIGNSKDSSSAYLSALKPNLAQSLDLLSDIVRNATFPPQEIEKFRARAIDSLRQGQADNQQLGSRALNHALYGDRHPYGAFKTVNASIQGVEQITQQDLIAWRNSWLRPDNVTIFASGDVTAENLRPLLEKQFGKWQPQGPRVEKNMPQHSNPAAPKVI